MLPSQRELFDIPEDRAFFNAAAWAPMPKATVAAGERAVSRKARPWEVPKGFDAREIARARGLAAGLIGAQAHDVAIVPSVGYGFSTAAKVLDVPKGERVIVMNNDHSAPVLDWLQRAEQGGFTVESVARSAEGDWTSALVAAIERPGAPPVSVASISSIHWSDGGLVDMKAIRRALEPMGGRLLVDATHAVGAMPVDVAEADPDFLMFPTYKWLLGPYGRAFLYVAPRHQDGIPLEQTSYGRKRVVATDPQHFTDLAYVDNAMRFDMGERDFFVSLDMASTSMEQIAEWGTARISERIASLTDRITDLLQGADCRVSWLPKQHRAPHILSLSFDREPAAGFTESLEAAKVNAAMRLGRLRISPHVYNNTRDCEHLAKVLKAVLKPARVA